MAKTSPPAPSGKVRRTLDSSQRRFERKVRLGRLALWFERVWPRLWWPIGVAAAFIFVSMAGVWSAIPETAHWALLGAFAVAALASLVYALTPSLPDREAAIRYLERHSDVEHRPATAYEDTLTGVPEDSATAAIWKAHKERLRQRLDKLEVAVPHADMAKRDPWALRVLGMGAVVLALAVVGDGVSDRLQSAFRFASLSPAAGARLDAWVTPPQYTARPPILLSDGRDSGSAAGEAAAATTPAAFGETVPKPLEVPDQSKVIVRIGGAENAKFRLELLGPECIELMNEEENLKLTVSPTLIMEFHGTTTSQLTEVLEMAEEICKSEGCHVFEPGVGRSERGVGGGGEGARRERRRQPAGQPSVACRSCCADVASSCSR